MGYTSKEKTILALMCAGFSSVIAFISGNALAYSPFRIVGLLFLIAFFASLFFIGFFACYWAQETKNKLIYIAVLASFSPITWIGFLVAYAKKAMQED